MKQERIDEVRDQIEAALGVEVEGENLLGCLQDVEAMGLPVYWGCLPDPEVLEQITL